MSTAESIGGGSILTGGWADARFPKPPFADAVGI